MTRPRLQPSPELEVETPPPRVLESVKELTRQARGELVPTKGAAAAALRGALERVEANASRLAAGATDLTQGDRALVERVAAAVGVAAATRETAPLKDVARALEERLGEARRTLESAAAALTSRAKTLRALDPEFTRLRVERDAARERVSTLQSAHGLATAALEVTERVAALRTQLEASLPEALAAAARGERDPKIRSKLERINAEFGKRVMARQGMDLGQRPSWIERLSMTAAWPLVFLGSEVGERILGKDYELSRNNFRHYLLGDGEPLVFVPPKNVQELIVEKHSAPGHYRVDSYDWGNADLRHAMGHCELDVIDLRNGKTLYVLTDRYAFPETNSKGEQVWHGFPVGTFTEDRVKHLNEYLGKLGEWRRSDGSLERFELTRPQGTTGEYSLRVPRPFLADIGVDFESLGYFVTPTPNRAAASQPPERSSK